MTNRVARDHASHASLLAVAIAASGAAAQSDQALSAFDALGAREQAAVLERCAARIRELDLPALVRVRALAKGVTATTPVRPRPAYDPAVYAPVAPKRNTIAVGSPAHTVVRSTFPRLVVPRDLHATATYDWLAGAAARVAAPPSAHDRFADLLAGYPPDADLAIAAVIALVDRDGDQRLLAEWCEHLYADRDGKAFAEVTLYEAWYSGNTVEVPDVDAIAFARTILHTEAFASPIPAGARRDRLYRKIREAFARHREYRTLCEAAAAAAVAPAPALDPVYAPLLDRMQLLWPRCGGDPQRLGRALDGTTRNDLLRELDDALRTDDRAREQRDGWRSELAAAADQVREIARAEVAGARR